MSTIHTADCPLSWDGYQAMDCECETTQAPATAEIIISRVAHLLAPAEITRMRSSLEIDLHMGEAHAINRAVRSLESHRLGYRSGMSRTEMEAIAEISKLARLIPQPIAAPRDWNDEAAGVVATYASQTQGGYALHSEDADRGGYSPYFRSSSRRNTMEVFA